MDLAAVYRSDRVGGDDRSGHVASHDFPTGVAVGQALTGRCGDDTLAPMCPGGAADIRYWHDCLQRR